jgi:MraZ protein
MSSQLKTKPIFTGEYCHRIDDKKRVTIPSDWRSGGGEFFIQPHPNPDLKCLIVMPPAEFQAFQEKTMSQLPPAQQADFLRLFAPQSLYCEADKQGRLLLGNDHCQKAALKGDVVLVAMLNRFEIWNPAALKAYREKCPINLKEVASALGL